MPPTIALTGEPQATPNGLQMSYKLEDDYGVVGAQAIFKLMTRRGTNGHPPRNLYEAPEFPLVAAAGAHAQRRRAHHQEHATSIPGPAPTCR